MGKADMSTQASADDLHRRGQRKSKVEPSEQICRLLAGLSTSLSARLVYSISRWPSVMPILPPRNLPLSPKSSASGTGGKTGTPAAQGKSGSVPNRASPSTPSPSKRVGTAGTPASPSPLRGSSSIVEEGSDQYGQLGRQDETTFHRRLRTLLWDHRAAREAWEDLVSMQGAKSVASLARLAAQLDELMANGGKLADRYDALPAMLRLTQAEADARRAEEMATVWTKLQLEKDTLDGVIVKLGKPISRLEALSDAAETLLVDITRTKGDQFAFEQEAWTTWPMARFSRSSFVQNRG